MGDRTYYRLTLPGGSLTEEQATELAEQIDFSVEDCDSDGISLTAEEYSVGYCQEVLMKVVEFVTSKGAVSLDDVIVVDEDGAYGEAGYTGTWSRRHDYHFVSSTDSAGPIVARYAVEKWWAEAANPLELLAKLKEYFGPHSKLDPKYDPCPECKAPLRKWREANHHDPGDVEPRAACTNPDCSFEY